MDEGWELTHLSAVLIAFCRVLAHSAQLVGAVARLGKPTNFHFDKAHAGVAFLQFMVREAAP